MARVLLLLVFVAPVACAQLVHSPVESFDENRGTPYYGGSYYLLAHTDGQGNLVTRLLWRRSASTGGDVRMR